MKRTAMIILAGILLVFALFPATLVSAAPIKVYDKDVVLQDDDLPKNGWKIIANDPGFYFDAEGNAVHKSPSLWSATAKSDKQFSWKFDTADKKDGASCLSQTYSTGFFFYWMSEFSGQTLDLTGTQYLMMDLYVEDPEVFLNANDYRIDFTDKTDKNKLAWDDTNVGVSLDTFKGQYLKKGWNSLKLYINNTDELANIKLNAITGMRFFAEGIVEGSKKTIKLDNVHAVSKGSKTEESKTATSSKTESSKPTGTSSKSSVASTGSASSVSSIAAESVSSTAAESTATDNSTTESISTETNESVTESVSSTASKTTDDPKSNNSWIWICIAAAALVVIGTVVVFIVIKRKK